MFSSYLCNDVLLLLSNRWGFDGRGEGAWLRLGVCVVEAEAITVRGDDEAKSCLRRGAVHAWEWKLPSPGSGNALKCKAAGSVFVTVR